MLIGGVSKKQQEFGEFMKYLGYPDLHLPPLDDSKLGELGDKIEQQCGDDENCKKQKFIELVKKIRGFDTLPSEQKNELIMQLFALWLELGAALEEVKQELEKLKDAIGNQSSTQRERTPESTQGEKNPELEADEPLTKEADFSNPFFDNSALEKLNNNEISPQEVLMYAVDVVLSKPEYQQAFVKMVQNPELVKACEGEIDCVLENALLAGFANKNGTPTNNYLALQQALNTIPSKEREEILENLYESAVIAEAVDDIMKSYMDSIVKKDDMTKNEAQTWEEVLNQEGIVGVIKKAYETMKTGIKGMLEMLNMKDKKAENWSNIITLGGVVLGGWMAFKKAVSPTLQKWWKKFNKLPLRGKILGGVGLWFGKDVAEANGITVEWIREFLFGKTASEELEIQEGSSESKLFYLDAVVAAILPADESLESLEREGIIVYDKNKKRYEFDWEKIKDHPLIKTVIKSKYNGDEERFRNDLTLSLNSIIQVVPQDNNLSKKAKIKDIVAQKWRMVGDLKKMITPEDWNRLKEEGKYTKVMSVILRFEMGDITFEEAKTEIQKLLNELGYNEGGSRDDKIPPSNGGGGAVLDSTSSVSTAGVVGGAAVVRSSGSSSQPSNEEAQVIRSSSSQGSNQRGSDNSEEGDRAVEILDWKYEELVMYLDNLLNKCECNNKNEVKFLASLYVFIPFLQGQINEEQAKATLEKLVFSTQADYIYLSQGDLNSLVYSLQSPDFMDFDYVSIDPTLKDESPLPISVIAQLEKLDESGALSRELNISLIYSQTINVVLENFGQHLLEDGKYKKKLSELKTIKKELYQATDGLLKAIGEKDANKIQQNLTKVEDIFKKYNEKLKNIALYVVFHSTLDSEKKYYLGVEFLKKLTEQREVSPNDWLKVVEILDDLQYGLSYASSLVETSMLSSLGSEEKENIELQQEKKIMVKYLDKVACQRYGEGCEDTEIDKTLSDLNEVPDSVIRYIEKSVKFMGFSLTELIEGGAVTKHTIKAAIVKGFPEIWRFFRELKTVSETELKWSDLKDEEKIALFETVLGSRIAVEIIKSAMRNKKRKESFFALIDDKYSSHDAQVLKSYFEWLYQRIKSKEHDDAWSIVKSLAGMTILIGSGRLIGSMAGLAVGGAAAWALRFNKIGRIVSSVAKLIRWEKWGQYGKMFLNTRNIGYAASFTYLNEPVQYALEKDFGKSWEAIKKSLSKEYGGDYLKNFLGETAFFGLLEAAYPLATWMTKGLNRGQRIAKNAGALFIGGVGYTGINFVVDGEPPSFEEALNAAMILLLLGRMGALPEAREGLTLRFTNGKFFIGKKELKEWIDLHKNYVLNTNGWVKIKNVELMRVSANTHSFDKVNLFVKSERGKFNVYEGGLNGKLLRKDIGKEDLLKEDFWLKTIGVASPDGAKKVVEQMRRLLDMGDTSIASAILKGEKGLKGTSSVVINRGGRNIEVPRKFQGLGGKYKFERIDPNTGQRMIREFPVDEVFKRAPSSLNDIEKGIIRAMRGTGGKGIRLSLPKKALGLTKAETNRRIELAQNNRIEEIFKVGGKNVRLEIEKGSKKLKFQIQRTSSSGTVFREDVSLGKLKKELGDKGYLEFIEKLKNRSITRGLLKEGDYVRFETISGETIELKKSGGGKVEVKEGNNIKVFKNEEEALRYLREQGKGLSIVKAYLERINSLDKSIWDTLSPAGKKALSWTKDKLKITWRELLQKAKNNRGLITDGAVLASIPIGDRYLGGGLEKGSDIFGILAGGTGALLAPSGKKILTFLIIYSIVQGLAAWRNYIQEHPIN